MTGPVDETPSGADGTKILLVVAFVLGLIVLACGGISYLVNASRTARVHEAEDLARDVEQLLASPTPSP
jgi:hypothetical protein